MILFLYFDIIIQESGDVMIKLKYKEQSFEIDQSLNTCIFSKDIVKLNSLLKEIAGINKSDILVSNKLVYDNMEYFKERVYIDNELEYLNTLNSDKISSLLLNNYLKVFNDDDFKRLAKDTHVRFYYDINLRNKFDNMGRSIINNIFALSIICFRIINNPFKNIKDINVLDILKKEYNNKKGNLFSDNLNNICLYKDILDKVIIINKKVFIFDSSSNVILINGKISEEFDDEIIYQNKEHYYYRCELLRNVEFANLIKSKKYKMLSLYEMGEDYE